MKLWETFKNKKESKNGKRFYTSADMSEIKHQEAIKSSQIKRGERENKGNHYISVCGCGHEGCFIHNSYDSDLLEKKFPNLFKLMKGTDQGVSKLKHCIENFEMNQKSLEETENFLKRSWPFDRWKGVPNPNEDTMYKNMLSYYPETKYIQKLVEIKIK